MGITRRLLVLALLCLSLAAATSAPASATFPGRNGLIAFVRAGNIYTFDPATRETQQLTTGGGISGPHWSPNGRQLAYKNHDAAIFVRTMSTAKTIKVSTGAVSTAGGPIWSPNGARVGYIGVLPDPDQVLCGALGIYTVPNNGSAQPHLAWDFADENWDYCAYGPTLHLGTWAPNRSTILVSTFEYGQGAEAARLTSLNLGVANPLNEIVLVYCYDEDTDCSPARVSAGDYGPGGKRILFSAYGGYQAGGSELATLPYWDQTERVYVTNAAGSYLHQVSSRPVGRNATWSPDGSEVLFTKKTGSKSRIVEVKGTSPSAPTTTLIKDASQPDWQPLP